MYKTLKDAQSKLTDQQIVELVNWANERKAQQKLQTKKYQLKVAAAMKWFKDAQTNPNGPLGTRVAVG